jgi:hypothetical protein
VVFCNGTWFDDGIIDGIVKALVNDTTCKNSRILALTSHELSSDRCGDLEVLESVPLAASWNSDVRCFLYKLRA